MSHTGGSALRNFNIGRNLDEKIIARAAEVARANGWDGEGEHRFTSVAARELFEIGFVVLELFGDDWKEQLKIQSEPKWAKVLRENQELLLSKLEEGVVTVDSVVEDNTTTDMSFEGMFE